MNDNLGYIEPGETESSSIIGKMNTNDTKKYTIKDNISIIGSTPELILSVLKGQIRSESIAGSNYTHKTNEFILDKKEIIEQFKKGGLNTILKCTAHLKIN